MIINGKKLHIEYPASWQYKLVGKNETDMHKQALGILKEKPFTLLPSKASKTGKFVSLTLEVLVYSDDERIYLFEALQKADDIYYVL